MSQKNNDHLKSLIDELQNIDLSKTPQNCIIHGKFIPQKVIEYISPEYILLDINSLTIVPYLITKDYIKIRNVNIRPVIETLKFVCHIKYVSKNLKQQPKIVAFMDNGLLTNLKKMQYKMHRYHTVRRNIYSIPYDTNNSYSFAMQFLNKVFNSSKNISFISLYENDFVIAYFTYNLHSQGKNVLVISADRDYLCLNDIAPVGFYNNGTKKTYIATKNNTECLSEIVGVKIKYPIMATLYLSLMGNEGKFQKSRVLSKRKIQNLFEKLYKDENFTKDLAYSTQLFDYIKKYVAISEQDENKLKRNFYAMYLLNFNLLTLEEKKTLDFYLKNLDKILNETNVDYLKLQLSEFKNLIEYNAILKCLTE